MVVEVQLHVCGNYTLLQLFCLHYCQVVQMVTSGLLVDRMTLRVELKCATMQHGGQCVMTSGEPLMLLWSVDSWDSPQQV